MNSRTRTIVISISAPVIAFAIVGGLLGKVMAREETYQHLKIFDDVVNFITEQLRRRGQRRQGDARRDARTGRRPRSRQRVSHRRPGESRSRATQPLPAGDVGLELTRQYYLRVIAARDDSPAAKAGLRTRRLRARHQRQADARDVGVGRHARAARRAGLEGDADDHSRQRRRSARRRADARSHAALRRHAAASRRRASAICASRPSAPNTLNQAKTQIADLQAKGGARS